MKHRILSVFLAACLCLPGMLSGCDRASTDETAPAEETAPQLLTHVYGETPLVFPDDYRYSSIVSKTTDSVTLLCTKWMEEGEWGTEEYRSWNEASEITFYTDGREPTVAEKGELSYDQYTLTADGTGYGTAYYYDEETGKSGFRLDRIQNGVPETLTDNLTALFGIEDEMQAMRFSPAGLAADSSGRLYIATYQGLGVFQADDMTPVFVLNDFENCQGLEKKGDEICVLYYDFENVGGYALAPVLADEKKIGEPMPLPEGVQAQSMHLGEGYDLYYLTETGLYGYNTGAAEGTLLMSMANSNLPSRFQDIAVLDSEHIFVRYNMGESSYTSLLTKSEDIDLSSITILEMATLWQGSDDLNSAVVSWNKAHPDCRINMKDYSTLGTEEENGANMLLREIETGVYTPDLYYLNYEEVIRYLAGRDLLQDFYPLMEGEAVFNSDNLFGGVKNTYTTDGTDLYGLPVYIHPETVIADRDAVGDRTGWTVEECLAVSEQMLAEGRYLPAEILMDYGNTMQSFIDWETYTCSFDSELFIRLLDYFLLAVEEEAKLEQMENNEDNRYAAYLSGYLTAAEVDYRRISQIMEDILYFGEDKVTVGYPTADGKGGTRLNGADDVFMLSKDCADTAAAWEFIKTAMPKEDNVWRLHSIAAWKHIFDAQIEEESSMHYFVRYDGGMSGSSSDFELDPDGTYRGRPGVKTSLTEEKAEAFRNMLDTAGSPISLQGSSDELNTIMEEEMSALLAGTCTTAECAARIQSRASLWLAEHSD